MSDDELLAALFTNRERAELFDALDNGELYVATLRGKSTPKDDGAVFRPSTFGQPKPRGRNWTRRAGV